MNSVLTSRGRSDVFGAEAVEEARARPGDPPLRGPGGQQAVALPVRPRDARALLEHRRATPWPDVELEAARAGRLAAPARAWPSVLDGDPARVVDPVQQQRRGLRSRSTRRPRAGSPPSGRSRRRSARRRRAAAGRGARARDGSTRTSRCRGAAARARSGRAARERLLDRPADEVQPLRRVAGRQQRRRAPTPR